MDTTEINLDTFTSDAIARYKGRRLDLEATVAAVVESARSDAQGYTKQEITDHLKSLADLGCLRRVKIPGAKADHSTFVEAYVMAQTDNSLEAQQLERLRAAATADRTMAQTINWHLRNARRALAELREALESSPKSAVKRGADSIAITETVANLLGPVARAVTAQEPYDIRTAAEKLARSALQRLVQLPRDLFSNGLAGASRAEGLYEAAAAQEIFGMVREAYGDLADADTIRIGVGDV